jgi:hypothetical protein
VTAVPQGNGTRVTDGSARAAQDWAQFNRIEEIHMKANVGDIDRALRVLAGIGLLALVFVLEGNARWLGLVGLVPLATGLFGFCPVYTLLGLSTCPRAQ